MLAEVANTYDWWATTGGVLGALVFIGLLTIGVVLREWWKVRKLKLAKEEKTLVLLDNHIESAQKIVTVLDRIDRRQELHNKSCQDTHEQLNETHDMVSDIHKHVVPNH
jgi:uncharacterized membrane protein YcjF (UPF0283 family)